MADQRQRWIRGAIIRRLPIRIDAGLNVIAAVAVAAALATFPAWAAADWPVFGHDLANSRDAGAQGPSAQEAASLQQAWTFNSSNGDFTGTPVVAGGILVAGTNLGSIFALDAATGKVRWSRQVGQPINGSAAIDLNTPAGPTVFVPVATIGHPRLMALALGTGDMRWSRVLTRQSGSDVFGSPTFWRGTVYIGTSGPGNDQSTARGSVVAVREATGRIRWRRYTVPRGHDGGGVWRPPQSTLGAAGCMWAPGMPTTRPPRPPPIRCWC